MQISWIGAGNMTKAFLEGFKGKYDLVHHVSSRRSESLDKLREDYHFVAERNNVNCVKNADIVVLAVKPQQLHDVCLEIKDYVPEDAFVISIAVGISLELLESWLGRNHKLIRMMPTTAVSIKKGSIALCCNQKINTSDLQKIHSTFESVALLTPIQESDMNVFVSNSGSGIAFVYRLMAAFVKASMDNGIEELDAKALVAQTFVAAAEMAKANDIDLDLLIKNVSSKNGTTVEGLAILDQSIDQLILDTFEATQNRAAEIQDELSSLYAPKS